MSTFNRFGATEAAVLRQFDSGDYTAVAADMGGSTNIAAVMDECEHQIVQALPERVLSALVDPELELLVRRATAGQVTAQLSFFPIVAGTVSVWVGQPLQFVVQPKRRTDPGAAYAEGSYADGHGPGYAIELAADKFSVNASTGLITLTDALAADDQVYASSQVDVTSASYSIPSLAALIARGAAARLGYDYLTQANQVWGKIEAMAKQYAGELELMAKGAWIIPEHRRARWWQEIAPTTPQGGASVRLHRG